VLRLAILLPMASGSATPKRSAAASDPLVLRERLESLEAQKTAAERRVDTAEGRNVELHSSLVSAQARAGKVSEMLATEQAERRHAEEAVVRAEARFAELQADLNEERGRAQRCASEVESLRSQLEASEAARARAEAGHSAAAADLRAASEKAGGLEAELASTSSEGGRRKEEFESRQANLEAECEAERNERISLQQQLAGATAARAELEQAMVRAAEQSGYERATMRAVLDTAEARFGAIVEQKAEAEEGRRNADRACEGARAERRVLQELVKALQGQILTTREDSQLNAQRLEALNGELQR